MWRTNRKMKAIPDLMKAMKYIPKSSKLSLLVIGDKMDTREISRLVKESGNEDKIHFLGYRIDAINIVASCDVFVLPSINGESLTKSVIEAMSLGIVPVISDIAGNKPLVDDGKNGFIFKKANPKDLADTLMHVYNHQEKLKALSIAATLKIKNDLNVANTINRYETFYRSIL